MANNLLSLAAFINLYADFFKNAYIRKLPNGKYRVFSEKGKNMGTYDSKEQAKKRLRQIEFFKHKKASTDTIDVSHLDNVSYSSLVRELRKTSNDDATNDFISMYKKCFDSLVIKGNNNPAECALPLTILQFKKVYNLKLPENFNDKETH